MEEKKKGLTRRMNNTGVPKGKEDFIYIYIYIYLYRKKTKEREKEKGE